MLLSETEQYFLILLSLLKYIANVQKLLSLSDREQKWHLEMKYFMTTISIMLT